MPKIAGQVDQWRTGSDKQDNLQGEAVIESYQKLGMEVLEDPLAIKLARAGKSQSEGGARLG